MKKDEQITEHIWKGEYLKSFLPGNNLRSILIKYSLTANVLFHSAILTPEQNI